MSYINEEIAKHIAEGLIETGVEGPFDAVSCSTAGDYPSIGCSQWEGKRADILLSYIDGGDYFTERSYSDIEENDEIEKLEELLDSPQGQEAQLIILGHDCEQYVEFLQDAGLYNPKCIIYAGIWCPTSHYVVSNFLERCADRGININNLEALYWEFFTGYAQYADCEEYEEGYQNRAETTYFYVKNLEIED